MSGLLRLKKKKTVILHWICILNARNDESVLLCIGLGTYYE